MCQRSSGAPAQTYVLLAAEAFRFTAAEPAVYRSSARGERRFCAVCGSQVDFRDTEEPGWISVNSGTLDDPALVPPDRHIWTESEVAWFREAGDLPRFDHDG
jgi:hypothetical protein